MVEVEVGDGDRVDRQQVAGEQPGEHAGAAVEQEAAAAVALEEVAGVRAARVRVGG